MTKANATMRVTCNVRICDRRNRNGVRAAFTLLEVILVLALIVAVVSIAATNMRGSVRRQRLVKGAEQVRTEWARARLEAIKNGRVYVFYHAMETRRFIVVPQSSFDDAPPSFNSNMSFGATSASSSVMSTGSMLSSDPWRQQDTLNVRQRELPDQVMFLAANVQFDERSAIQLNQTADPSLITQSLNGPLGFGDEPIQDQQWGTPIYFFPDGSSSSAEVVLMNHQNESICVYLRGMTGLIRVGNVEQGNPLGLQGTQR